MGNKFLEQEGDVSTLGVRLDIVLIILSSNWDARAPTIFLSPSSLDSPRLCCCGDDRREGRSVKLPCIDAGLEDCLEPILLVTSLLI